MRIVQVTAFAFIFLQGAWAFVPRAPPAATTTSSLQAAPRRLEENVEGPLFVNEKCINCAACSMFAPSVFSRSPGDGAHIVHHQPSSQTQVEQSRAALAACPVAAIRVETKAHRNHRNMAPLTPDEEKMASNLAINPKFNGLPLPFPRSVSENIPNVYFVGHHNSETFGAAPYLFHTQKQGWILVDTPTYSKSAVNAIESLTGPSGPSYLVLTHVDDTAGHNQWKEKYPNLQRIFHSGDLGLHNWVGDATLEHVEVLLREISSDDDDDDDDDPDASLQWFTLQGTVIEDGDSSSDEEEVVIVHTPGHSPGSISVWRRPTTDSPGVLFTGDTYSYTTRGGGRMTGFPRYGNDRRQQSRMLPKLLRGLEWQLVAPGHGHVRDYTNIEAEEDRKTIQRQDMEPAIQELMQY